jgi:hypothetical protein
MMTLEEYAWRSFIVYHIVAFVVLAYLGQLPAWGMSVFAAYAIVRVTLYWDARRSRKN